MRVLTVISHHRRGLRHEFVFLRDLCASVARRHWNSHGFRTTRQSATLVFRYPLVLALKLSARIGRPAYSEATAGSKPQFATACSTGAVSNAANWR